MSGLREALDEIVADVPVYGDLDRALEQARRERRRRYGAVAGLTAAAAVVAVIVGLLAVAPGSNDPKEPVGPIGPTPTSTPTPTQTTKSQSPRTWADTSVAATSSVKGWNAPDPLERVRASWFPVVAEHLDPTGQHLEPTDGIFGASEFVWPAELPDYDTYGRISLIVDRSELNLFDDGCRYLRAAQKGAPAEQVSCSAERFTTPGGQPARIAGWGRRCGSYEGGGPAHATCGDYVVGVAVERSDGLLGYLRIDGRGTPDSNPFARDAMAAAVTDPGLTLPESALAVPIDHALHTVVEDHFPAYRADPAPYPAEHPGYAQVFGRLGRLGLGAQVWPAGRAPTCGRSWLVECVERRVYGADDPTTVFVGAWDEDDWADCCPRNSRAFSRQLVRVGPRNTVVVSVTRIVREHEDGIGSELDRRVIDLLLDPRLQDARKP